MAMLESIGEAPLPLGWDTDTSKGTPYYINHVEQFTTWVDPRLAFNGISPKQSRKKGKLPPPPKYKRDLYGKVQSFQARLHQLQEDQGELQISVSRDTVFEDSYNLISNLDGFTLTRRLFIKFTGEEGLDYGGMSRELFLSLSREFTRSDLHLFELDSKGYHYNISRKLHKNKHHLQHFFFLGQIIGMAIYHGKLLEAQFSPVLYKCLLGDSPDLYCLRFIDEDVFKGLEAVKEAEDIDGWDLTFSVTESRKSKTKEIDLKTDGSSIDVTNENKEEYIQLVVEYHIGYMLKAIASVKEGMDQLVPQHLLEDFTIEEFEQMLNGTQKIDVNNLRMNTDYTDISESSATVKWFWEILSGFTDTELQKFLHFVTGSTKVPVGGFKHLCGSKGPLKFNIAHKKTSGLPTAHSCFNRLEVSTYSSKDKLRSELLYAVTETTGFGLQ